MPVPEASFPQNDDPMTMLEFHALTGTEATDRTWVRSLEPQQAYHAYLDAQKLSEQEAKGILEIVAEDRAANPCNESEDRYAAVKTASFEIEFVEQFN